MSDADQVNEIEYDPLGYVPRPDLFVRNLTPNTITFNVGKIRWSLPPWPNLDYEAPLPWTVAKSSPFERLWTRHRVLVSTDEDFDNIITALPPAGAGAVGGGGSAAFIHRQDMAQSVVDIVHNLHRNGPVHVSVFSPAGDVEYWNFYTDLINPDTCRLTFEDPTVFVATVS